MRRQQAEASHRRVRFEAFLLIACGSIFAAGCSSGVRVQVDGHLTPDAAQWRALDGPRYVIHAPDAVTEASLGFEEFAGFVQRALEQVRPGLRRVAPGGSTDLVLTMHVEILDRGMGVYSRPVYGRVYGYRGYRYGRGYHYSGSYYAGEQVESRHLGFVCRLVVSAWVPDATRPAGRRVLWEGSASSVSGEPDAREVLPFLAVGLCEFYGQATGRPELVKLDDEDERVLEIMAAPMPTSAPAPVPAPPPSRHNRASAVTRPSQSPSPRIP